MLIETIIKNINKLVGNSSSYKLTYTNLEFYIDSAVYYINRELKTNMKTPAQVWNKYKDYYTIQNSSLFKGDYDETSSYNTDDIVYLESDNKYIKITNDGFEDLTTDDISQLEPVSINLLNYEEMFDDIIASVLVYLAASFYLEEEDEFESQHKTYMERASSALLEIKHLRYSCYDVDW